MEHEPRIAPMPEEEQPSSEGFLRRFKLPLIIVGGIVVLAGAAIGAAMLFGGRGVPAPVPGNGNLPPGGQSAGNGNLPPEVPTPTSTPPDGTPLPGQMVVEWNSWPTLTYENNIYSHERYRSLVETDSSYQNPINSNWRVFKVGKVTAGPYTGGAVYVAQGESSMGGRPLYRLVALPAENGYEVEEVIAITEQESSLYPIELRKIWTENHVAKFSNLEPPVSVAIPGSTVRLRRNDGENGYKPFANMMLTELENPERAFEYAPGKYVYKSEQHNCFFIAASDGSLRAYYFEWPFVSRGEQAFDYNISLAFNVTLTFTGGQPQSLEYVAKTTGGCGGYGSCYNYARYITSDSQVEIVATTPDGQSLYGLKDRNIKETPQSTKTVLRSIYDSHYQYLSSEREEKISYEEFLADHPVLYWRDPFGDYIQFTKASYMPSAECGKPVIYLYPEREMDVTVQVAPNGGFTVTEPEYPEGGWKVRAKPSGELYYYADGKTYPYLFWEGYAMNYGRPQEGFVVAQRDVETFLRTTLPKLGLVKHEYDEFIEFWLPKMQSDAYYRISFMPQAEFDSYAPLAVGPKPDTVIRVFMDYEGLDAPIAVRQPVIRTPERRGFTVVEWGGALH